MKKRLMQGSLAALLLAASVWGGTPARAESIGVEIKLTGGQFEIAKKGMDLSDDHAVWVSYEDKNQLIVLYSIDDENSEVIASSTYSKSTPKVDGRYVVWIDYQRSGGDLYLYDIETGKDPVRLTESQARLVDGEVDIQGNYVVWTDTRDSKSNIYAYDIRTGDTIRVTSSGKASHPSVSGNYVVYQDERTGNQNDIYYYDLAKKKEIQVTNDSDEQENPHIDGNTIVYEDDSDSVVQIYSYDISSKSSRQLTKSDDDDKENPQVYDDTVIYVEDDILKKVIIGKKGEEELESIYSRLRPSMNERYVLFSQENDDDELELYLYDLEDEESFGLGSAAGTPSSPEASNRYVVYLNEGRSRDEVVLYSVEDKSSKVISRDDDEPEHPVVSDQYVVWYDDNEEALISYNIQTGKRTIVTSSKENPSDTLIALYGHKLFWVDEQRSYYLTVTDLKTLEHQEVDKLGDEPQSIDIYGDRVIWVVEDGDESEITAYDLKDEETIHIREGAEQVDDASIGKDYAVWSELVNGDWEVYYYDFEYNNDSTLYNKVQRGDQRYAQISGNTLLYRNQFSRDREQYTYSFYDLDERDELGFYPGEESGRPDEIVIGGNRAVWTSDDEGDTALYTMAFSEPLDEPGDGGEDDQGKEYRLDKALFDGTLDRLIDTYEMDEILFVFRHESPEIVLSLKEAFRDFDGFIDLISEAGFSKVFIQVK